jgi:tetratricopeptide (TPR) repeat protein
VYCLYRRFPDGARGPDPLFPLTKKGGVVCIQISLRGLLAWGFALGVMAYFAATAALLHWYERAPYNRIGYLDLVVPSRWNQVSALRGEAIIAEAYDDLKAGNFQRGFAKLRVGLARNPADAQARLDLARIYVALRLRPVAERTLLDAFAHGYPGAAFVREGVALLSDGDHPEQSLLFAGKARAAAMATNASPRELRMIDEATIRTLLEADRSADALTFVQRHLRAEDELTTDVQVRHLLETKDYAEAVRVVEAWLERTPASAEALRRAVQAYRESGRFPEMQIALTRLRTRVGATPEFAAYLVVQNALSGQRGEMDMAVDDFLFRHGANLRNLQLLASLLADIGEARLILRIEQDARERGFDLTRLRLTRLQAFIAMRDWAEASALAETIAENKSRLASSEILFFQTLSFLALTCRDGASGAKSGLVEAISRRPGKVKLYRTVIESLLSAGQARTALEVLSFGEGPFPDSRYLSDARTRVTAQLAKEEATEQVLVVRKEEAATLPDVPALLIAVEEQAALGRREEALTLIRQHRRSAPALFTDRNPELARWEVRLPAESGDLAQLQFNLRTHLKNGALGPDEVVTLAKGWHAAGHPASARAAVRELLKRDPNHPAALRIWSEWMPTPDAIQPEAETATPGELPESRR